MNVINKKLIIFGSLVICSLAFADDGGGNGLRTDTVNSRRTKAPQEIVPQNKSTDDSQGSSAGGGVGLVMEQKSGG